MKTTDVRKSPTPKTPARPNDASHGAAPETDKATTYAFYLLMGSIGLALLYFLALPFIS